MALTESAREDKTNSQVSLVPTSQDLDCQACGRATDHQFKIHESVPAAAWTGQPIWECRVWVRLATDPVSSSSSVMSINQHLYRCLRVSLVNTVISFNSGASLDGEFICAGER